MTDVWEYAVTWTAQDSDDLEVTGRRTLRWTDRARADAWADRIRRRRREWRERARPRDRDRIIDDVMVLRRRVGDWEPADERSAVVPDIDRHCDGCSWLHSGEQR